MRLELRPSRRRGFTLVEMTVALCVIGTLGLIAVPTYLGYRTRMQDRATESVMATLAHDAQALARSTDGVFTQDLTQGAVAQLPADAKASGFGVYAATGFTLTTNDGRDPSVEYGTVSAHVAAPSGGGGTRLDLAMKSLSGNCVFGVTRLEGSPITEVITSDLGDGCRAGNATQLTPTVEDVGAPSTPTGLNCAVETDETVTLRWTASPENDVALYLVGQDGKQLDAVNAPATEKIVTGLTNDQAYSFTVTAEDFAGQPSAPSAAVVCTPRDNINPTTPSWLDASDTFERQINVSWEPSVDNHLSRYDLYRVPSGAGDPNWAAATVIPVTTASSCAQPSGNAPRVCYEDRGAGGAPGLTPGSYVYRVKAVDTSGNNSDVSPTNVGRAWDTTPPAVPSPTASVGQVRKITVSWPPVNNDVGDLVGYRVFRCTKAVCADADFGYIAQTLAGTNSWVDDLSPSGDKTVGNGTTYQYKVQSYDNSQDTNNAAPDAGVGNRSVKSTAVTGSTLAVPSCSTLTATGGQVRTVPLSWSCTDAASVLIERNTSNTRTGATTVAAAATGSSYTDQSAALANGTTYYYWVIPNNATEVPGAAVSTSARTMPTPTCSGISVSASSSAKSLTVGWTCADTANVVVQRNTSNTLTGATTVAAAATGSSYTDSDGTLGYGTTYYYWVTPNNATGVPGPAVSGNGMTLAVCTDLAATGNQVRKVPLSWTCAGAASVKIERNTNNTLTGATTVAAAATGATLTDDKSGAGLANGQTYYYWVTPVNGNGTVGSRFPDPASAVSRSATTMALPTCTVLNATGAQYQKVPLDWTCDAATTSVKLERATSANGTYSTLTPTAASGAYTDTGRSNNTWYYYKLTPLNAAVDAQNLSTTLTDSAKTLGPPTSVSITANCPDGYGATVYFGDPMYDCWLGGSAAEEASSTDFSFRGVGPDSWRWSSTVTVAGTGTVSATRTVGSVPLASAATGTSLTYYVKACNLAGCSSEVSTNLQSIPKPGQNSYWDTRSGTTDGTDTFCTDYYAVCSIAFHADRANTYEVHVSRPNWSGVTYRCNYTADQFCNGNSRGADWTEYWVSSSSPQLFTYHVNSDCSNTTLRTGCQRQLLVQYLSSVRFSGANEGWCLPSGGPPPTSECNYVGYRYLNWY